MRFDKSYFHFIHYPVISPRQLGVTYLSRFLYYRYVKIGVLEMKEYKEGALLPADKYYVREILLYLRALGCLGLVVSSFLVQALPFTYTVLWPTARMLG